MHESGRKFISMAEKRRFEHSQMEKLLNRLRPYVSLDDANLDIPTFLKYVRDRISDDLVSLKERD